MATDKIIEKDDGQLMVGNELIPKAYNTHYIIENYNKGDCPKIEADLSIWNPTYYRREEYFYYDETEKKLYLPRGYDINIVSAQTGKPVTFVPNYRPKVKYHFNTGNPPRDDYQREMIRYLSAQGEYKNLMNTSQQVLSLPTRSGKTYCTIAAAGLLESRALVIVNRDLLREQWADEICDHTNLTMKNIILIKSSDFFANWNTTGSRIYLHRNSYIFITTHRTIHNAIKLYGMSSIDKTLKDLSIGIKIIDEAHIEFQNTLLTDYATNVWKTFYLTATFARSDDKEDRIFQKSFNQVVKIAKKNPEREKTVRLFMVSFRTKSNSAQEQAICYQKMGFSRYNYIDYELKNGKIDRVVSFILKLVIEEKKLEGKILILSSKTDTCDHFKELVEDLFPSFSVCSHHSKSKIEDFREYGVICATPQMVGTGATIPKLRVVINTEPTSSTVNVVQIFGRLDIYAPGMDTYYFMIMDTGFLKVKKMFNKIKNVLKFHAKKIVEYDYTE